MKLSTRYGLVGIGALALLSGIDWLRERQMRLEPVSEYLMGVTPNFAAAIAISFVLMSIWADQTRNANFAAARYWFFVCATVSALGLFGWELFQRTSERLVFDAHDILATLVGTGTATVIFYMVTPRNANNNELNGQNGAV
ncbi:hypothetical protein [Sphingorhabdus sp.]|uniref:hypothetical protein n=1 Tax=Sphingorhabdus sp. TaxID=1902408 RepID=UPI0035937A48